MAELDLNLRKFDMNKINSSQTIAFIAQRRSGKSVSVKDIMFHLRSLPIGTVVCPTECVNKFYSEFVPPTLIHDEYTPQLINNVVQRQFSVNKENVRRKRKGLPPLDTRAFLILDDCMYDNSWVKDNNIRFLLFNGRHIDLLFIITLQYIMGMPPSFRTQFDFVFIYREPIISNRKRIYDNFCGMFPSFDVFCQVMDQVTEDYHCLVIDRTTKSNRLEDQVFWYKTDINMPNFRTCSDRMWEIAAQKAREATEGSDSDSDSDSAMAGCGKPSTFDTASCRPKSKVSINVNKRASHGSTALVARQGGSSR